MVAVCPHCSARVAIPVGGLVGCPACGRVSRSVAPTAAFVAAPVEPAARHHRIVWPRVAALAAITVVSGVGAVAALRDVANRAGSPARPAIVASSVLSSAEAGPRMGDLRGVAAQADENMLPTSRTVAGAAKPRAKTVTGSQSGNGFVVITGPRNGPPPAWVNDMANWARQFDGSGGSSSSGSPGRTQPRQPRQPPPNWP